MSEASLGYYSGFQASLDYVTNPVSKQNKTNLNMYQKKM